MWRNSAFSLQTNLVYTLRKGHFFHEGKERNIFSDNGPTSKTSPRKRKEPDTLRPRWQRAPLGSSAENLHGSLEMFLKIKRLLHVRVLRGMCWTNATVPRASDSTADTQPLPPGCLLSRISPWWGATQQSHLGQTGAWGPEDEWTH